MQQSKHSHSKPKKKSFPLWIPAVLLFVLILAAAAVFLLPKLRNRLPAEQPASTPEPVEVVEETPPEPVDLREYAIDLPISSNDAVNDTIEGIRSALLSDFNSRYDGSVPALLSTSYILGSDNDVFNFILTADMNGEISRQTWCIAQDGTALSAEEVLGERFAQYLSDYINLFYYTERWDFNDDGVMILYRDITEAVSSEAASFPLFLLNSKGGAEFIISPEAVKDGSEQHIHLPVTLPERFSYGEIEATEAISSQAPPLPTDGEEVTGETSATEAENSPPEIDSEGNVLGAVSASPDFEALASELGGFAVVAEPDVLDGRLLSYRRLYPNKPMVALTFDDGPSELYTLQILDILKSYNVVATFYEVGVNVESHPELVQKEVEAGCEVGSHTYYHYVLGEQTYDFLVYEHGLADQAFLNAIGFIPKTVRPPQGDVMGYTQIVYKEPLIGWSIDTLDWLYKDVNYNLKTVKNAGNLDGQVILLHSIHPTSLESVEPIVQYILSEGYQMVTISELLKYGYLIDTPEPAYYYQVDFFSKGRPAYPVEEETVFENSDPLPAAEEEIVPEG